MSGYALTPYINGQSLGVGIFDSEDEARAAQAALTRDVEADGLTVVWEDHGWVTEDEAFNLVLGDLF